MALLEPFLMCCSSTETQPTESLTPPADTTTRGIGSHSGSATVVASPFIPPCGFQITHSNMQPLASNGRCVWCKGHAIRGGASIRPNGLRRHQTTLPLRAMSAPPSSASESRTPAPGLGSDPSRARTDHSQFQRVTPVNRRCRRIDAVGGAADRDARWVPQDRPGGRRSTPTPDVLARSRSAPARAAPAAARFAHGRAARCSAR